MWSWDSNFHCFAVLISAIAASAQRTYAPSFLNGRGFVHVTSTVTAVSALVFHVIGRVCEQNWGRGGHSKPRCRRQQSRPCGEDRTRAEGRV
ncbi:hypothetical protein GE09DRAFT_1071059 [Coniochaeta sp. 2T2.1]|nr:hypothetical protein GE09DRAFT_1071059 [Coniochaeta sp. 2T2.1]